MRAGRPLHEALTNFAFRVRLEEARTLSTLFRQSQELGASVVRTLRTYSKEMRQMRLLRAEEKANALPIKMLFPMAAFLFPVNLIIVIVPILWTFLASFKNTGDIFGELAALGDELRSATVQANSKSFLLAVDQKFFLCVNQMTQTFVQQFKQLSQYWHMLQIYQIHHQKHVQL